jgi:hypothetical protein
MFSATDSHAPSHVLLPTLSPLAELHNQSEIYLLNLIPALLNSFIKVWLISFHMADIGA